MNETNIKLIINVQKQEAALVIGGQLIKTYPVSTARNGLGTENNSFRTPTGLFTVAEKFGANAPVGTVFKSRVPTGDIWSADINNPLHNTKDDLILTRILWLEGREQHNVNTKDRYIYIHGTNHEDLLGTPASAGCIRMGARDVIEFFDLAPEGTIVEIHP